MKIWFYLCLFVVLIASLFVRLTDEPEAVRVLQANGFTNIEMTGYQMFGCSDDDLFHTGFTATGANGVPIKGVVCAGLFKGSRIHYF